MRLSLRFESDDWPVTTMIWSAWSHQCRFDINDAELIISSAQDGRATWRTAYDLFKIDGNSDGVWPGKMDARRHWLIEVIDYISPASKVVDFVTTLLIVDTCTSGSFQCQLSSHDVGRLWFLCFVVSRLTVLFIGFLVVATGIFVVGRRPAATETDPDLRASIDQT